MGNITDLITSELRDFVTDGVASSGKYEPNKQELRKVGPLIEDAIAKAALGSLLDAAHATRAEVEGDLAHPAGAVAVATSDPVDANNDLYIKSGASGSGGWTLTTVMHDLVAALFAPYVAQMVAAAAKAGAPYDETATNLDAYLAAITDEIFIYNYKSHDLRVSLAKTAESEIRVIVFDEQLGDEIGYFELPNPDYANLPERLLLIGADPLSALPVGDPNGANFTGAQGWLKLRPEGIVVSNAVYQFSDPATCRINRRHVKSRFSYRHRHRADDFDEVIEVGPGRNFATIRAALESLYDGGPLADQTNPAQMPVCRRANPTHRIGIVYDPGTYTGFSEHTPEYVFHVARHRHQTIFEHTPGATTPIIEGQGACGAWGIVIRNTAPGEYGWHSDFMHLVMSPDSEGDYLRDYLNIFEQCRFVIGPNATQQVYGAGIGTNGVVRIVDTELLCENQAYTGIIIAANNASDTGDNIGGGRLELASVWDRTGRQNPAVGVQSKIASAYPNILRIDHCRGINNVSLGRGVSGGPEYPDQWLLLGDNDLQAADVASDITGDAMGL